MNMNAEKERKNPRGQRPFNIVDLNYVCLYLQDLSGAIEFYSRVFGVPENVVEGNKIYG